MGPERVYLVGVAVKGRQKRYGYTIQESLEELARLADTAGLEVSLQARPCALLHVTMHVTYTGLCTICGLY